jgi:hypothetical protein
MRLDESRLGSRHQASDLANDGVRMSSDDPSEVLPILRLVAAVDGAGPSENRSMVPGQAGQRPVGGAVL